MDFRCLETYCAQSAFINPCINKRITLVVERDHHGFDAPAPLGHPGRTGLPDGHSTGPAVGERLPQFTLPDASGTTIDYHADRAMRKSVVVLYRSAVW